MNPSSDFESFQEHVRSTSTLLNERFSEADTRVYLIDPILRILGYNSVADIRREVPVPATKEFLDYQLNVDGQPHVIVEAKALRHSITDQHAAQCVQYAAILGIRWCLISNGQAWALYDGHAKGPLAEKKVAEVSIGPSNQEIAAAWQVLSLFKRESLTKSDPLLSLIVRRVVEDELKKPDSAVIVALQKSVLSRFGERVSGQAVVRVLTQLLEPIVAVPTIPEPLTSNSPPTTSALNRRPAGPRVGRTSTELQALIEAGLIPDGAELEMKARGENRKARVVDGRVQVGETIYDSLSSAAAALAGYQVSGWEAWTYKGERLRILRNRLTSN